jgi:multidrug resistance efflux pump
MENQQSPLQGQQSPEQHQMQYTNQGQNMGSKSFSLPWPVLVFIGIIVISGLFYIYTLFSSSTDQSPYGNMPVISPTNSPIAPMEVDDAAIEDISSVNQGSSIQSIDQDIAETNLDVLDQELDALEKELQGL